jgi:hypothetical protein
MNEKPQDPATTWFFTRQKLGGTLRELYAPQVELPREMVLLVAQIDQRSVTSVPRKSVRSRMKPRVLTRS